ncbi:MAG: hypothetical protein J6Z11_14235 [Candidatus Riflebacteria bacterium]|nr:hypothetical protein [Candidatus Riflebacteria bacterium]
MIKILNDINKFFQTEKGKKLKELLKKIFAPTPPPPHIWVIKDFPKKE